MVDPNAFEAEGGTWDEFHNAWTWVDEHDKLHREDDLPAYIDPYTKIWSIHGDRHRDNGPAYVQYEGMTVIYTEWFFRGKRHRLDGPAIIRHQGNEYTEYYVDNVYFANGDDDAYKEACRRFRIEHGLLEPGKLTKPARPAHT